VVKVPISITSEVLVCKGTKTFMGIKIMAMDTITKKESGLLLTVD